MNNPARIRVIESWSGTFDIQVSPLLTEEEYLKTQIPTEFETYQRYLGMAEVSNDVFDRQTQDQKWGLDKPLSNNIDPIEFLNYIKRNKTRLEEQR